MLVDPCGAVKSIGQSGSPGKRFCYQTPNKVTRFSTREEVKIFSYGLPSNTGAYTLQEIEHCFMQCVQFQKRMPTPVLTRVYLSTVEGEFTISFPLKYYKKCDSTARFILENSPDSIAYDPFKLFQFMEHKFMGRVTFQSRVSFVNFFERFGLNALKLHMVYIESTKYAKGPRARLQKSVPLPKLHLLVTIKGADSELKEKINKAVGKGLVVASSCRKQLLSRS